jgi:hypothetical protein
MRYIFPLISLLFALWCTACEPDSTELAGSSFDNAELVEIKSLRVFSRAGEEKNPLVIKRFAQDTFNLSATAVSRLTYYVIDSVRFGASSAVVKRMGTTFAFDLTRLLNIVLTDTESRRICCTTGETIARSLIYSAGVFKPIIDSDKIESSVRGNYIFSFVGKEHLLLNLHGNTLRIPCILLSHHSQYVASYLLNNKLDPSFSRLLPPGDTVSVLEMTFQLNRL